MARPFLLILPVVASMLLAGCTGGDGEHPPRISAVALALEPIRADPTMKFTICWSVEGSGNIPHTAVHWDDASHGAEAIFSDYDAGVAYPGNATAPSPSGYELPGRFCSGIPMPAAGRVHWRAHAMLADEAPGVLSVQSLVKPSGLATAPTIDAHASLQDAGDVVEICWRVGGTGNVAHTALHFDSESHPAASSFTEYRGGAVYPDDRDGMDPKGYDLPGRFCAHLTMPETGAIYFQAHVIDRLGGVGEMSGEDRLLVV